MLYGPYTPALQTMLTTRRLWQYLQPGLGLILATCCGTLVAHETRVLSTVAMLYLQAVIMTMTALTLLAAWGWLLEQDADQLATGVVVGCVAMMMGVAVFAFFRVALIWWMVEDCGPLGVGEDSLYDESGNSATFQV